RRARVIPRVKLRLRIVRGRGHTRGPQSHIHRTLGVLLLTGEPTFVSRSQRVSPVRERNRLSKKLRPIQSRDLDSPRRTVRADLPHQSDELLIPLRTLVRLHPDSPRYLSPDQIQTMQGRPSVELGEDLNHG